MDGVLVDTVSSWDFVHRAFGLNGRYNFERYLRGEFDYPEFLRKDIELWGNVHIDHIRKILDQIPLMKGAKFTINTLRNNGYLTAIISSGLYILAKKLKKKLGIDYIFANELVYDKNGMLTGEGIPNVSLWNKASVLQMLLRCLVISPDHCAVIGDSIFDVPLFDASGFSIAFNSNDQRVINAANVSIQRNNLRDVLPYFITKDNVKKSI
jgi:phosphoserine phosphatase